MNGERQVEALKLGPERIVVGMGIIASLHEHGSEEDAPKARDSHDPLQFRQRIIHVLQGNHGRGIQTVGRSLAEVGDPVVIRPGQGVGAVRVLNQGKALGKPGRVEQGLIHAHGVHIPQPGLRVRRSLGHGVPGVGVELPDLLAGHARSPDGVAGDVGVNLVVVGLAVDFEVGGVPAVFPPQGEFAQGAIVRL